MKESPKRKSQIIMGHAGVGKLININKILQYCKKDKQIVFDPEHHNQKRKDKNNEN